MCLVVLSLWMRNIPCKCYWIMIKMLFIDKINNYSIEPIGCASYDANVIDLSIKSSSTSNNSDINKSNTVSVECMTERLQSKGWGYKVSEPTMLGNVHLMINIHYKCKNSIVRTVRTVQGQSPLRHTATTVRTVRTVHRWSAALLWCSLYVQCCTPCTRYVVYYLL